MALSHWLRAGLVFSVLATHVLPAAAADVLTYHNDNRRTGWNAQETVLTPAGVASPAFGLLQQVALDQQVDAEPLFVSALPVAGGTHDVVYAATENNTIYAIDAQSGAILAQQNYGTPVPGSAQPVQLCSGLFPFIGIHSTPVIDRGAGRIYFITYTFEQGTPVYRLHAADLTTLQDVMPSTVIGATGTLANGRTQAFDARYLGQRTALLLSNGVIYAGFNGWCEAANTASRGWVLGWQAATLTKLPAAKLLNQQSQATKSFFLNSVWMSGAGIASDDSTGVYFLTGNATPNGKSYSPTLNLDESAVRMSADLSQVADFFTPQGGPNGWAALDKNDNDFSAGGILLLPDQPGAYPHLAAAAGKEGPLYLMNRDDLGHAGPPRTTALGEYTSPGCWCMPAYYQGSDGTGRVVTSAGDNVQVWRVQTGAKPKLVSESLSPSVDSGQFPGFFTSISSNGTQAGSAVIWVVTRPVDPSPGYIRLEAYDPAKGSAAILAAPLVAGTWPLAGSTNANLVPMVANGQVFVASYANLSIYGLAPAGSAAHRSLHLPPEPPWLRPAGARHSLHGALVSRVGNDANIRTRTDTIVEVQLPPGDYAALAPGTGLAAFGDFAADGRLVATQLQRVQRNPAMWQPDF